MLVLLFIVIAQTQIIKSTLQAQEREKKKKIKMFIALENVIHTKAVVISNKITRGANFRRFLSILVSGTKRKNL